MEKQPEASIPQKHLGVLIAGLASVSFAGCAEGLVQIAKNTPEERCGVMFSSLTPGGEGLEIGVPTDEIKKVSVRNDGGKYTIETVPNNPKIPPTLKVRTSPSSELKIDNITTLKIDTTKNGEALDTQLTICRKQSE